MVRNLYQWWRREDLERIPTRTDSNDLAAQPESEVRLSLKCQEQSPVVRRWCIQATS